MLASECGHTEVVQLLLAKGAAVDAEGIKDGKLVRVRVDRGE